MPKPKLLLADDSITIQKVVSLTFADKGMDVVAFSDGDAAIEHLDEENPDIILADVHMPGINGYQVCELIRSNESTKNTPVVLLVGSFEPFDREEADRVGANTHLTKPFTSIADVVSTVDRLLAESAKEREAVPDPGPDTSDIDSLYQQSFVETMELPQKGSVEYEMDGYDDEMIQTSYAEPDLSPAVEESLYQSDADDGLTADTVEFEEVGAESLIAESLPDTAGPAATVEPEAEAAESEAIVEETTPELSDPFESVAAEPPPVQAEEGRAVGVADFSFEEMDLLELPGVPASAPVEHAVPNTANGREIVSLSPELIELIVQKVVERLAEKDRGDEARSMSGS